MVILMILKNDFSERTIIQQEKRMAFAKNFARHILKSDFLFAQTRQTEGKVPLLQSSLRPICCWFSQSAMNRSPIKAICKRSGSRVHLASGAAGSNSLWRPYDGTSIQITNNEIRLLFASLSLSLSLSWLLFGSALQLAGESNWMI